MRLCVVGTGYVGLVTGSCLADAGNIVTCVDRDATKLGRLVHADLPIYEPGLQPMVERNLRERRLFFSTELRDGLRGSEVCFITVDTPLADGGRADLTNVLSVAEQLGELIEHPVILVTKSTVPVGTTFRVKEIVSAGLRRRRLDDALLEIANNPEFLKEGSAVGDFMEPDRVIVGVASDQVAQKLHQLYLPFMRSQDRFVQMDIVSSEFTKYAANAMLATRISFMNELARLCERVGADIDAIRKGLGCDPRIGPRFLFAGLGYGGSCFPKDMRALIHLGKSVSVPLTIVESVDRANQGQREWFWSKIRSHFSSERDLQGKRFAMWGLAFKPDTDDVRFAPSLFLIEKLLEAGAEVVAYDPVAVKNARQGLGKLAERVTWSPSSDNALHGADALVICTEWREFRSPDFSHMRSVMRQPLIFDGRILYDPHLLAGLGFKYVTIGRPQGPSTSQGG